MPNNHKKGTIAWQKQNRDNQIAIKTMKADGMKNGVADFIIYLPTKQLQIELKKTKGGTQSKEQKEWEGKMSPFPYVSYYVCKGWKVAVEVLEKELLCQ